jgi:hypothetical protein
MRLVQFAVARMPSTILAPSPAVPAVHFSGFLRGDGGIKGAAKKANPRYIECQYIKSMRMPYGYLKLKVLIDLDFLANINY